MAIAAKIEKKTITVESAIKKGSNKLILKIRQRILRVITLHGSNRVKTNLIIILPVGGNNIFLSTADNSLIWKEFSKNIYKYHTTTFINRVGSIK